MILNDLLKIQSNIGSPPMGRHFTGLKISLFVIFPDLPTNQTFKQILSSGNKLWPRLSTAVSLQLAEQDWGDDNFYYGESLENLENVGETDDLVLLWLQG